MERNLDEQNVKNVANILLFFSDYVAVIYPIRPTFLLLQIQSI